jgi:predicted hotdog family 3-hydroxylacyl-ACP dehydratase
MGKPPLPAIEDLLPHRGSMLLLQALLSADEQTACALANTDADAWYSDGDGAMPAWIGIELMAQTIAAHVGWCKSRLGQPPKQGVLLGTRAYRSSVASFRGPLHIEARLAFLDDSGLGAYDCSIASDDKTLAVATVKVFEPADFQSFIHSHSNSAA